MDQYRFLAEGQRITPHETPAEVEAFKTHAPDLLLCIHPPFYTTVMPVNVPIDSKMHAK